MKLKDYGIELEPLSEKYLELVRFWRNSDKIRKYARNKNYITQEQQQKWFKSLKDSIYYIVKIDNKPIGLVWVNNLSTKPITGFYIYEDKYLNSIYSYKVIILFYKFLFSKTNRLYTDILEDNLRAIRFNLSLGFKKENNYYVLTKEIFEENIVKIETIIRKY